MVVFLTSSPSGPLDGSRLVDGLDCMNYFVDNLRKYWRDGAKCLMIAASPDAYNENDEMKEFFSCAVKKAGLSFDEFMLWDGRNERILEKTLNYFDVIFLGGGHVPTQNQFFKNIGLKEKIQKFEGIVIGISAGTMNSADEVYAQPELEGESTDLLYKKYLTGLGLTKTQILPHYQMVKEYRLDGKRLYEDITYADSYGKNFLVLPDGSYLLIDENGEETVWGEAWSLSNGKMSRLCSENEKRIIEIR